jgi:lipopolysaccharide/colanic/teichoic acid biosynthesis glycosyltransferase
MLKNWEELPEHMRLQEVKPYYDILKKKQVSIFFKRIFDILLSLCLLAILAIPMLIIAILIKIDSEGTVFYRQERVTRYGKVFRIHKFRTMVSNADKIGTLITLNDDKRVTRAGKFLRKVRLDEIPQIFDILAGNMSFVGTRPEVPKYVKMYEPEFYATLLMPAGVTSEASIRYIDEDKFLKDASDMDTVYVKTVLPQKMEWNLYSIKNFSFFREVLVMMKTVFTVIGGICLTQKTV